MKVHFFGGFKTSPVAAKKSWRFIQPFLVGVSVESLLAMEIIPRTHGSSDVQQISPKGENPPPGSSWQFCW